MGQVVTDVPALLGHAQHPFRPRGYGWSRLCGLENLRRVVGTNSNSPMFHTSRHNPGRRCQALADPGLVEAFPQRERV